MTPKMILDRALLIAAAFAVLSVQPKAALATTTIEEVIHQAWLFSPQLSAQEVQTSLSSGDRWRRYVPNEPQLQYANSDDHSSESFGVQLSTSFPGKAFALKRLDAAKYQSQSLESSAKKYELAKIVAQAYLDCASSSALVLLQTETSSDLETVYRTLRSLYETGHATQAEKIGAELLSRQAQQDFLAAKDKEEVQCAKFASLLKLNNIELDIAKLELPEDVSASLISEIGPSTSDQARAQAAAAVASATGSTAWWSQAPDLTFGIARNHYPYLPASPSGKIWTNNYSVSITLPLLFPLREQVEVRRSRSQATIDLNVAEAARLLADSDQSDAAREYKRSRARLDELRRRDLALGEALVESTYSAYRSGKLGYAELVLSRKILNDLRTQDILLRLSIVSAHLRCLTECDRVNKLSLKESRP